MARPHVWSGRSAGFRGFAFALIPIPVVTYADDRERATQWPASRNGKLEALPVNGAEALVEAVEVKAHICLLLETRVKQEFKRNCY